MNLGTEIWTEVVELHVGSKEVGFGGVGAQGDIRELWERTERSRLFLEASERWTNQRPQLEGISRSSQSKGRKMGTRDPIESLYQLSKVLEALEYHTLSSTGLTGRPCLVATFSTLGVSLDWSSATEGAITDRDAEAMGCKYSMLVQSA